jgi:4-amino-4-deoxy-L-arabinose transferase-like glycosyltransferase
MNLLQDNTRRRSLLAAVFIAALILRLAAALSMPEGISWEDGIEYDSYAASLQKEGAYLNAWGYPSAYRPPGYPVFLLLSGRDSTAVRMVQSVAGAITVLLVYLAAVTFLGRLESFLAASLTAIYPLYIYAAGTFYPVVLLTLLLSGSFILLIRGRREDSSTKLLLAGVLAGIMALTKGSCLPAFLLATLWLAVGKAPFRYRLRRAAVFLLPVLIITGGWGVRNYRALGSFRPLSTNSGYNFWLGNYPGVSPETGNRKVPGQREEELAIREEHRGEIKLDRAFFDRGLEYVREDPGRFVTLTLAKALNLFRLYPSPMTRELKLWEKLAAALSYGPVLILALFFLLSTVRRSSEARLILLILAGYAAAHAPFISKVRLRLPVDFLLIISACGGIRIIAEKLDAVIFRQKS